MGTKRWTYSLKEASNPLRKVIGDFSISFSPDGSTLASLGSGSLYVLDVRSGTCRRQFQRTVVSFAFLPDSKVIQISSGQKLIAWDIEKDTSEEMFETTCNQYYGILSKDGTTLGTLHYLSLPYMSSSELRLWDVSTGEKKYNFYKCDTKIVSFLFDPSRNSTTIAICLAEEETMIVHVWDAETNETRCTIEPFKSLIHAWDTFDGNNAMAFLSDGKTIVLLGHSTYGDEEITVWNHVEGSHLFTVGGRLLSDVVAISYCPETQEIASGGSTGDIRVWDIDFSKVDAEEIDLIFRDVRLSPYYKIAVADSYNHKLIVCESREELNVWDIRQRVITHSFPQPLYGEWPVISKDAGVLVTRIEDKLIWLNFETENQWEKKVSVFPFVLENVKISSTGNMMAGYNPIVPKVIVSETAFSNDTVISTGELRVITIHLNSKGTRLAVISEPKEWTSSMSQRQTVELFSVIDGGDVIEVSLLKSTKITGHYCFDASYSNPRDIAMSEDGRTMAWKSYSFVIIWETTNEYPRTVPEWDGIRGKKVILSREGTWIALRTTYEIHVLNLRTSKLQTFELELPYDVSFLDNDNNEFCLMTHPGGGRIPLERSPSQVPELTRPCIQGDWVVGLDGPLVWLPPFYRTDKWDASDDILALINKRGELVVIYWDKLAQDDSVCIGRLFSK